MNPGLATGLWVRLTEDVERAIGRRLGYWRVLGVTDTGRLLAQTANVALIVGFLITLWLKIRQLPPPSTIGDN